MWRSRFTKPEEIKRDLNGKACKEMFLSIDLLEQPVELWPHIKELWGSRYEFKRVPVLRLKVVSVWRTVSGKLTGEYNTELLDEKKSILPECGNARWVPDRFCAPNRHYEFLLPGSWNGKGWSWGQHSAFWLVTSNGEDIPIVHDENSRFWSFGRNNHNPRLQFKILSPLNRVLNDPHGGAGIWRIELRRREDETGGSVVELSHSEDGKSGVLLDTTKHPLVTLVYALNDKSGWREKLLARTIVELRNELIKETVKANSWEDDSQNSRIHFEGLRVANGIFFDEAIRRFGATKAVSRHKAFADFRKLLEVGRTYLTLSPIQKNSELLSGLRSRIDEIPSRLK